MKKILRTFILIITAMLFCLPFTACTTSGDDLGKFPTEGVWVCTTEDYTITITLGGGDNPLRAQAITINYDGVTQELECFQTGGHGTPLSPSAPATILIFESEDEPKVHFQVSKFKFNENDFYFLNISLYENHTAPILKNKSDLHFIKKV